MLLPVAQANSAFYQFGVSKWVPASAGKAKAGMVHSVRGQTRGCAGKTEIPWQCVAVPEHFRSRLPCTVHYKCTDLALPLIFTVAFCLILFLLAKWLKRFSADMVACPCRRMWICSWKQFIDRGSLKSARLSRSDWYALNFRKQYFS